MSQRAEPPIPFVVTNWVRAATQCGIDLPAIFRKHGVDTSQLHPPSARIQRETLQHIMQDCIDACATRPQHFPIVLGECFAFEYLSDVETFITTSGSLREATRSLDWIPPLINPNMAFSLAEYGPHARITLQYNHADATHETTWAFTEAVFTTLVRFSRGLMGADAFHGRLTFRHAAHAHLAALERFFQVPIEWDADVDALWFERSLLDRPLTGALPALHEQAAQRVAQQLAARSEPPQAPPTDAAQSDLVTLIAQRLRADHGLLGQGISAVADALGVHPRTLQRRLKEAGAQHSSIQDQVRHELACQWLADAGLSIEDISERLGFSDRRSFTQAFTRWSGQTPRAYRQHRGLSSS